MFKLYLYVHEKEKGNKYINRTLSGHMYCTVNVADMAGTLIATKSMHTGVKTHLYRDNIKASFTWQFYM